MTNEHKQSILRAIDNYTKKCTATPEAAKAALVNEGIYLEGGRLSPNYGGPATS